jgi:hypothetical protein
MRKDVTILADNYRRAKGMAFWTAKNDGHARQHSFIDGPDSAFKVQQFRFFRGKHP